MTHTVRLTPEALHQLDELETHIAGVGSPTVAARYVDAIVDYCENLRTFPHRGTRRDDILPGLRTLGYRRRVTIAFEVTDEHREYHWRLLWRPGLRGGVGDNEE